MKNFYLILWRTLFDGHIDRITFQGVSFKGKNKINIAGRKVL